MKSTKSSSKSPAPATKSASAAKKTAEAPTAVRSASAMAKTGARQAAAPKAAPSAKAAPAVVTIISARIDVGFGNTLHLRGDGPGLNWLQGALMRNVASDLWTFTLDGVSAPVRFKFLLNDEAWANGEDYVVEPGAEVILTPIF